MGRAKTQCWNLCCKFPIEHFLREQHNNLRLFCYPDNKMHFSRQQHTLCCANVCKSRSLLWLFWFAAWMEKLNGVFFCALQERRIAYCIKQRSLAHTIGVITFIIRGLRAACARANKAAHTRGNRQNANFILFRASARIRFILQ